MDERYQYKTLAYLIILLFSASLFGVAIPVATVMMVKLAFFRDGSFTMDLASTWSTFQWIGAVVLIIMAFAFEIFLIITVINIIKEFVRRKKERSIGQIQSSVIQTQEYDY